jgi:hypothetical protein
MKKIALIVAALALVPAVAMADTTVAAKVSTLGFGIDAAYPVTESIDARIGLNTFSYNVNKNSNGTNYAGKLNLGSLAALADWHPMGGSFRVSGGLMYNNNKFSMTAVPTAAGVTVGGTTYTAAQAGTVSAAVDFAKVVPYLGIGWGSAAKDSGFSFASDIGIMFQGTARSSVTSTGSLAGTAQGQASLAQANADLNNSLKNFRYYPVVSIGLGYTF